MTAQPEILNPTTFVVIGDGLSAGAGDFGMSEQRQRHSFPALAAARFGVRFAQPPRRDGHLSNLSIAGLTLGDALTRRPGPPLVHRSDSLQTAINLVLGLPKAAAAGDVPGPTAIEYAASLRPTLALVALGCFDVLIAAFRGDPAWLPDEVGFRLAYGEALTPFGRMPTTVVICTLPDPADTAYFTPVASAARVVKAEPAVLTGRFGLAPDDWLTPAGLFEIGCRLIAPTSAPLPDGAVAPDAVVRRIAGRVTSLNAQIHALARERGAIVLDLHGLHRGWKQHGLAAGGRRLSSDYLGGLFSLNGIYPGAAGHGAIANLLLEILNARFGTSYAPIDLGELAAVDPVAAYRAAGGPAWTMATVPPMPQTPPQPGASSGSRAEPGAEPPDGARLVLPDGLDQELPLDVHASVAVHAWRVADGEPDASEPCADDALFGGACLAQTHLRGRVRIRFMRPEGDLTRFEVTHGDGLIGDDGVLAAPALFRMPAVSNGVSDAPGLTSGGHLNLATGEVSNLSYHVRFSSSSLTALANVNDAPEGTVVAFPGVSGGAWAKFEPRSDGALDFTFTGLAAVQIGDTDSRAPRRVPLPFTGPACQFASIPAGASSADCYLHLSTRPLDPAPCLGRGPEVPINAVREFTIMERESAISGGTAFESPGSVSGRAEPPGLSGRLVMQFGERVRDSVPVLVSAPAARFPSDTSRRPGVGTQNRFLPDSSIGAIDLRTSRLLGPLIFRTIRPAEGPVFRGLAAFSRGPSCQTVFTFRGIAEMSSRAGCRPAQPSSLQLRATDGIAPGVDGAAGGARGVRGPDGRRFSYSFSIPGYPAGKAASFEYVDETTGRTFTMNSLVWVNFSVGVVTFTALGFWSDDGLRPRLAAVQISTNPAMPYVSIQIDGQA